MCEKIINQDYEYVQDPALAVKKDTVKKKKKQMTDNIISHLKNSLNVKQD